MAISKLLLLVAISFANYNSRSDTSSSPKNAIAAEQNEMTINESTNKCKEGESIVGAWQLTGVTEDKNGNKQLDANERASAKKSWDDYVKLNSDGSAIYTEAKLEARYELNPKDVADKDYLTISDKAGTHKMGYVIPVTKTELVMLNKSGGDSFTIWKRL